MTRGWMRLALASLCLLLLAAKSSRAHKITGTDVATVAQLVVDHAGVTGVYELQFGELAALEERKRMDGDGDGRITAAEQAGYLDEMRAQLAPNLTLEIGGEAFPVRLAAAEMLPDEPLVAPVPMTLRYQLSSGPADFAQPQQLLFRDANALPRLVHADIAVEGAALVDIGGAEPREGALKQVRVQSPESPVETLVLLKPSEELWQSGPFATGQTLIGDAQPTGQPVSSSTDRLQEMLRSEDLGAGMIVFALVLSLFLGAAHALEPGHGKTIVAAYLIGSKGTVGNAVFLGSVVTFTHTFSVIILGLITLFASQYILPEQIFPWLGASSGLLIMGLGGWLFVRNLTGSGHGHSHAPLGQHSHGPEAGAHGDDHLHDRGHPHDHSHDQADHAHDEEKAKVPTARFRAVEGGGSLLKPHSHGDDHSHDHDHPHLHGDDQDHDHSHDQADQGALVHSHGGRSHSHVPEGKVTLGSLLALGISGGIVPCPGALVILLLAVALHRIAFGLTLIVSFSLGLAAVLIGIGVLMVKARPLMDRFSGEGKLIKILPVVSSLVIILVGFAMGVRSLMEAGIVIINL